ncbi:MAG: class I SAM-dependent methyltransferase [Pseudonocardiaceae bacterium]
MASSQGRGPLSRLYRQTVDDLAARAVNQQRALSYGARAELYDRVRPSYPPQALSCLLAALPAAPGQCRVVDVGAGTGKLTAVLAQAGFDVDAVEPDAGMRTVLAQRLPEVRVHAGRGEALPLADASVDAVVYGNSWHWVDDAAGAEEAARVLRPGGVLAMLWNYEDDDMPWVSTLERLVGIRSREWPTPSPLQGFRPAEVTRIRWSREQDVAALPDYALSHSTVAVLPDRQREEVLAAVRRMATEHPDLIGRDHITVTMQVVRWIYRPHH